MKKQCMYCGKEFYKPSSKSINAWINITKYCSKVCKDSSVRIYKDKIERKRKWYERNKNTISTTSRENYYANREQILRRRSELRKLEPVEKREKRLKYLVKYRQQNKDRLKINYQKIHSKFDQYISSAKRRGYIFELDQKTFDILFISNCFYCGSPEARGLDRIDNKVGYTKENSVPCCEMCNKMKWKWDKDQFLSHINKIASFNNKTK